MTEYKKDYFGNVLPFKKEYLSNMDSSYVPQYAIGAPTSPQTANQIAEATSRLKVIWFFSANLFAFFIILEDRSIPTQSNPFFKNGRIEFPIPQPTSSNFPGFQLSAILATSVVIGCCLRL